MINKIIKWFLNLFKLKENNEKDVSISNKNTYNYYQKNFMTPSEINFYNKLKDLENDYNIVPQLNLASIIDKKDSRYRTELFRNIDFAIFTKDFKTLLLLIELNDPSHENNKRKRRDFKVKDICQHAGIKLMTFYTKYPNEKNYVIQRIRKEIEPSITSISNTTTPLPSTTNTENNTLK